MSWAANRETRSSQVSGHCTSRDQAARAGTWWFFEWAENGPSMCCDCSTTAWTCQGICRQPLISDPPIPSGDSFIGILRNRQVAFNIKGNDYRLIVAVAYKVGVVYVKFVGTHRQNDAVDAETVEMG